MQSRAIGGTHIRLDDSPPASKDNVGSLPAQVARLHNSPQVLNSKTYLTTFQKHQEICVSISNGNIRSLESKSNLFHVLATEHKQYTSWSPHFFIWNKNEHDYNICLLYLFYEWHKVTHIKFLGYCLVLIQAQ